MWDFLWEVVSRARGARLLLFPDEHFMHNNSLCTGRVKYYLSRFAKLTIAENSAGVITVIIRSYA